MEKAEIKHAYFENGEINCHKCGNYQVVDIDDAPGTFKCDYCESFMIVEKSLLDAYREARAKKPVNLEDKIERLNERLKRVEKELGIK